MKRFFLLLALLALYPTAAARGQSTSCTIAIVVDGDTVNCRSGEKIRLLLINAPDSGRFGFFARSALATLLPAGSTFEYEVDQTSHDARGRVLAYVFLEDERLVNEIMVRQGYAFYAASQDNQRYAERLRMAEQRAREDRIGVWAR